MLVIDGEVRGHLECGQEPPKPQPIKAVVRSQARPIRTFLLLDGCRKFCRRSFDYYYLLVCTTCTYETTVSRLAILATSLTIYRPVLAFWLSDRKCRLKGNLYGPMKTSVGP